MNCIPVPLPVERCRREDLRAVLPHRQGVGAPSGALVRHHPPQHRHPGLPDLQRDRRRRPGPVSRSALQAAAGAGAGRRLEIRPKPDGPGSTYQPTQAGREFSDVMVALQHWGSHWAELTPQQAHPGVVLWMG